MVIRTPDPADFDRLIADRRARGIDRYDEVWDGDYIVSPIANNQHQWLASQFIAILKAIVEARGLGIVPGPVNVSDRKDDWTNNFRTPDVTVFLNGGLARDCDTHWLGGPDFLVEILSPYDTAYEKLPFYASIGTREVLIVDRNPWRLELRRLDGSELRLIATSTADDSALLSSEVLPCTFRLLPGEPRPKIEVHDCAGTGHWVI